MKNLLLGVTGSVATTLIPKLLTKLGDYNVKLIFTEKARYFLSDDEFDTISGSPNHPLSFSNKSFEDRDEWEYSSYHKHDTIRHIELATWADLFAIVPCTANTIGKIANGICDNLLTSAVMAYPYARKFGDGFKPLIIAPAMNTEMLWNPATQRNLHILKENIYIIDPQVKMLACGTEGIGALADLDVIVQYIKNVDAKTTTLVECAEIREGKRKYEGFV
jgi:phosphopantothenoylcysteine synthetase/decarboxylase